ncbi:OprO/OprP family phosphate-selective porin [Salinicola aestuarinus]|uniref:OprO/OprP family phosphate-selective porin n=1 Tax=Salinicola aestuarinus TaxID=1949082 RepID=UPI001FD98A66|nr:OprO/OprP family phosphate-selective porin [Salinicola aestuarinus]
MTSQLRIVATAVALTCAAAGASYADLARAQSDEGRDTLQVHGFMSQALVVTDHNAFFGPSDEGLGSLEYTELGLNVSRRLGDRFLVAGQVLSRVAGDYGDAWKPTLDYGVVDYQALTRDDLVLGLQVGRFKNPFGFYNQTRDVPTTRPSVLLPQSIYYDRSRSLGLASDGVSLYGERRLSNGTLYWQGGIGVPQINEDAEISLSASRPDLEAKLSTIGQLLYAHDGGRINVALSMARVRADYRSRLTPSARGDFLFQPVIASFEYNAEHWSLTSEYEFQTRKLSGFEYSRANRSTDGESLYVQYQYRITPRWQWLLRYDYTVSERDDRDGRRFAATGLGPSHTRFARDLTTGVQWRITPRWSAQAEWHYIDGTAWLPRQDNPDDEETDRYWNLVLFQTAYSF